MSTSRRGEPIPLTFLHVYQDMSCYHRDVGQGGHACTVLYSDIGFFFCNCSTIPLHWLLQHWFYPSHRAAAKGVGPADLKKDLAEQNPGTQDKILWCAPGKARRCFYSLQGRALDGAQVSMCNQCYPAHATTVSRDRLDRLDRPFEQDCTISIACLPTGEQLQMRSSS